MMEKMEERKFKDFESSQMMVKDFTENLVWREIKQELEEVIGNCRDSLEVVNNITEMARFQARIEALRYVVMLPQIMLDFMIETKGAEDE